MAKPSCCCLAALGLSVLPPRDGDALADAGMAAAREAEALTGGGGPVSRARCLLSAALCVEALAFPHWVREGPVAAPSTPCHPILPSPVTHKTKSYFSKEADLNSQRCPSRGSRRLLL